MLHTNNCPRRTLRPFANRFIIGQCCLRVEGRNMLLLCSCWMLIELDVGIRSMMIPQRKNIDVIGLYSVWAIVLISFSSSVTSSSILASNDSLPAARLPLTCSGTKTTRVLLPLDITGRLISPQPKQTLHQNKIAWALMSQAADGNFDPLTTHRSTSRTKTLLDVRLSIDVSMAWERRFLYKHYTNLLGRDRAMDW